MLMDSYLRRSLFVFPLLLWGCGGGEPAESEGSAQVSASVDTVPPSQLAEGPDLQVAGDSLGSPGPHADPGQPDGEGVPADSAASPGIRPTFSRPDSVRGIYLNAWASGSSRRREALISLAQKTELNSFVIDIKDATGYISHRTHLPLASDVGATGEIRIRDLPGLLNRLKAAGIYPIARIVVSKDPLLASGRPDLAIQDSAGGVWMDQDSVSWLNLYHREVWDYHVDLAREVVKMGFPEVQWDYVRFPDAPEHLRARAVFPTQEGRSKTTAVRGFLGYSRDVLSKEGALVTADVFGVTTSYRKDVGIGQLWESFIDQVDVALPMVYPSHYWAGSFGFQKPNAYPYEVVRRALREAVSRSAAVEGAGSVRPWLQDFTLGEPRYGSPEVRAQIQATYDAGIGEWILWNPGCRYTEAALMPAGRMPSWLEPVMRVGGEVVKISERFRILGEVGPDVEPQAEDTIVLPDLAVPSGELGPGLKTLPAIPLPDTVGIGTDTIRIDPDTVRSRAFGGTPA